MPLPFGPFSAFALRFLFPGFVAWKGSQKIWSKANWIKFRAVRRRGPKMKLLLACKIWLCRESSVVCNTSVENGWMSYVLPTSEGQFGKLKNEWLPKCLQMESQLWQCVLQCIQFKLQTSITLCMQGKHFLNCINLMQF